MKTPKSLPQIGQVKRYIYHCHPCGNIQTLVFEVTGSEIKQGREYPTWICLNPPTGTPDNKINRAPFFFSNCPICGCGMSYGEVTGKVTEQECNDSCTHAIGAICHCSCGGANHGKAWESISNSKTGEGAYNE